MLHTQSGTKQTIARGRAVAKKSANLTSLSQGKVGQEKALFSTFTKSVGHVI